MRTIGLFSITITMVVVGTAAWSASTHSAVKAELPQIDPLSLEANAKNLPSQEELNLKLWPQDAIAP
jgi:hypothetical protein